MQRLIDPTSIVVIGASPRAGSFGERLLRNLVDFSGDVFALNPKYSSVGVHPCYPALTALPKVPDCAVLVGNRDTVERALRDCADAGVGGAIVFASGFAETGLRDRIVQQANLRAIARETGVRVVGPNCMGVINCISGARMTFQSVMPPRPEMARPIGLVSQSGALGLGLAQASERGVAFSHVLTCGNSCDVDVADFVDYLVDDPSCGVIACSFEGMSDPLRLIFAAQRAWAADKPLIIYKMATGALGTAAAASHTGALAGEHATYRALLEEVGVLVLDDLNSLIETAVFFAKAETSSAEGVAVLATSGGAAIIAADAAERQGVLLPQPSAKSREVLSHHVPEFGSIANPCDVTAQVLNNPDALDACADALLGDTRYGAMVVPHTLSYAFGLARIATFNEVAQRHSKIVCNVWMSEWVGGPGTHETEASPSVALFRSMESCFAALSAWHMRGLLRATGTTSARKQPTRGDAGRRRDVEAMLLHTFGKGITERVAKGMLARYGVRVTREVLAANAEEAVQAARDIGFPVAIKLESVDIPHKTEAGVVCLHLGSDEDVRRACNDVVAKARIAAPRARIGGFLVQEMIPAGVELMVGGRIDPMFGPLVLVGFGGIFVELLQDSTVARAPVDIDGARKLIGRLKTKALLHGFRGLPLIDLDELAEVISVVSLFISDHKDHISELDINPLIATTSGLKAVDALIVVQSVKSNDIVH